MRQSCRRVAIALLFAAWLPITSAAQTPSHLNHQGILMDSNGVVVADGEYGLEFGIYDAPAAGTLHFQQQLSVNVVGGLYNVLLSDAGSWVLKDAFDDPNRFLQIRIVTSPGGTHDDLTLEPRQQIASVPFAFRSDAWGVPPPPPLPAGAIILWDQSDECPTGYSAALEYAGLTIRGAGAGEPGIPTLPGTECPGGAGCDADARYDDVLDVDEMPSHTHDLDSVALFGAEAGVAFGIPSTPFSTSAAGGGQPHYHPFRTVLFCRKD